jgi:hypothetical protein
MLAGTEIHFGLFHPCRTIFAAPWAPYDSIRPAHFQHELTAILVIAKVLNRFD